MLTIKIQGGLGNQLFQYALGLALQESYNKKVQYEISFFNSKDAGATSRHYLLEIFNIGQIKTVTQSPLKNTVTAKAGRLMGRKLLPYYKQVYIEERQQIAFDPNIFKVTNNAYLDGYWQSYKYFEDVAATLKEKLTLKEPFSPAAQNVYNKIKASQLPISIHVRRTDYISKYADIYHVQEVGYYQQALDMIFERVPNNAADVFVFSDDLQWCTNNLKGHNFIFADNTGMESYEDMFLMQACHHNIIANSTYSWWAAWLNNNPKKNVVAPKNWFKNQQKNEAYLSSLYPQTWITL